MDDASRRGASHSTIKETDLNLPATRKPLRLWHQSMTELKGLGAYRDALVAHSKSVLGDEVKVQVEGVSF